MNRVIRILFAVIRFFIQPAPQPATVRTTKAPRPFSPMGIVLGSFSIDATTLLDTASSIFNGLWPAFGLVAGIALGAGLLATIVSEIRKAF